MAGGATKTADELSTGIKSLVDRVLEADVTDTIAQRGRELAAAVADASETAAERAQDAWRESAPTRREATKAVRQASRDAGRWTSRTWRRDLRPQLKDLWSRRGVALGAAGAAVPASRELVDAAAQRLGVRRRESRHWGAFFLGMLIGAAAGAAIALLTAPKPGREMRDELAEKARDAGEWVPIFQRETNGRGESPQAVEETADAPSSTTEAVADEAAREGDEAL